MLEICESHQSRVQGIGQNFTAGRKYLEVILRDSDIPRFGMFSILHIASWHYGKEYDVADTQSTKFPVGIPFLPGKDELAVNLRLNVFTEGFNLPLVSGEPREEF